VTTYGANSCILETSEVGPRQRRNQENANTKDAERWQKTRAGKEKEKEASGQTKKTAKKRKEKK